MQTDLEEALANAKDGDDMLADLCREAQRTITNLRAELAEARAKAFEEAAKVAEGEKCSDAIVAAENIAGSGDAWLVNHICDEIAQAIRAMIDKG